MGAASKLVLLLASCLLIFAASWPDFRGPEADGHSKETNLPINWSESKGVKWKVELPGRGWSTAVVVDNEIWLTTATEEFALFARADA